MGCVSSGLNAAINTNNVIVGTFYPLGNSLLDSYAFAFGWLILLAGFLLSKGLATSAFVIMFILVFLKDFIVSIAFNWQSLFIIIVLAICIFVFAMIWSMIRTGVNLGILPAIMFLVSKVINPIIRLFKKLLKMVGAKLPFDEIDEDSLSEGMPTLYSLLLLVLNPLIEMILSPLRSKRTDDSSEKCKSE